ncbi:protein indeterminate-domain 4, chloroplastic-like [Silene latifolia]|uniref:protein indeterminate-domain 4, chloroplastic-like n=1 Tax=Silene latifolia TaxID=37657 RepID=UPI003D78460F
MATSPPPPPPPPSQQPQLHLHEQYSSADTPPSSSSTPPPKKKRSLPGAPNKYPDAEVIALSPKTLMATNRFICEVCNKGFQREQNLQLHRRGHNLPWKLKQKNSKEPVRKKVYLCPEPTCVHHDPTRALGDLTGIKKHYFRKHGEKKFKCEKCAKRYAVLSDWKAHSKTCGTKEYCCECGTKFSRRDSFTTHRAFCEALNQESNRLPANLSTIGSTQLFGSNGSGVAGNNMGLGMGLSNHLASHHPSMSSQQMTADILRLGGGAHQFDHLLSTPLRSDQHQNNIQPPQPNFSLSDQLRSNQCGGGGGGGYENGGHGQNQRHNIGGGNFSRQLNQLPEFQGNGFSLGFFPNNNNSNNNNNNADTSTMNSGSTGSGDHSSALFSPSGGSDLFGGPPHMSSSGGFSTLYNTGGGPVHQQQSAMSATALLQKAAQMGSTNSTTNATVNALLKGFVTNPPPHPPSPPTSAGGGFGGLYGENDQNNLHDLLIQNLSRDNNVSENNNYCTGSNPTNKSTQGGISGRLSDHMTRDFLGVGEVVRSMNGGGFTARAEVNQGGGNGISMPNNLNNADQVSMNFGQGKNNFCLQKNPKYRK